MDAVAKAVATAVVGVLMGWTASALTLVGRVDAIEASQARIEAQLVRVLEAKAGK